MKAILRILILALIIRHVTLQIVSISFGSEKKTDPMQGVLFYGKDQPDIAEEWNTLGIKRTV